MVTIREIKSGRTAKVHPALADVLSKKGTHEIVQESPALERRDLQAEGEQPTATKKATKKRAYKRRDLQAEGT